MMYSNGPPLHWDANSSSSNSNSNNNRRMAPRMRLNNRTALRPLDDPNNNSYNNGSSYDNQYNNNNINQFGRTIDSNNNRGGINIGSQAYATLRLPSNTNTNTNTNTNNDNNNNNTNNNELPALKMTSLARAGMNVHSHYNTNTNNNNNNNNNDLNSINSNSSQQQQSPRGQGSHNQQRELAPLMKKSNRSGRQGTHRRRLKQESSVNEQIANNHSTNSSSSNSNTSTLLPSIHTNTNLPQIRRGNSNNEGQQTQMVQSNGNHFHNFQQQQGSVQREFASIYNEDHQYSAVTSIKGLKPGNPSWINQDNMFISEFFENKDLHFYCVLDGHGEHGHHVSRKCRENFLGHIKSSNFDMKRAFAAMQHDLNTCEFDVRCSGATCVLVCLSGGRLSTSNCGDSRAVLGRRNQNGVIGAHALTNDHKPDKPEERKRILSCGGHLGCRQVLVNQPGRGPVSMPVGPCRVWYQYRGETLGLAMSRSLGDSVVHKSGVSAEPEIFEHMVDEYDEFVIIATDGVWDVVDNNQAVQMVASFISKSPQWSPLEASACICKFARSRWEKLSPMVDDITCVVIKLRGRVE